MALSLSRSNNPPEMESDIITVASCRSCSSAYEFMLKDDTKVSVLCGRPPGSSVYKAVSYLWEMGQQPAMVQLKCRKCNALKKVPMRDAAKLMKILNFVSGGEEVSCNIWLDALSIDQDDPRDLAEQLVVMGDIYRNAESVAVLLPKGDEGAYEMLRELAILSQAVVKCKTSGELESSSALSRAATRDELAKVSESYLEQLNYWTENIHKWRYWKRAWTFQEWAMASELEIACEIASHHEILCNIKNIIVMASSIIGHQKNTQAQAAGLTSESLSQIMRTREETSAFLNQVRLHFPLEDALIADNELEGDDLRVNTFVTAGLSAIDSGTYITPLPPGSKALTTRAMLGLALNAINTSERTAHYKADLVACWASMCNISYDYHKHDTFAVALHKVLTVLRKSGVRVYNFQVNTVAGETDLKFLKYAAAMKQSNSSNGGLMFGNPIFTGRADTVSHMRLCLEEKLDGLAQLHTSFDVRLQEIENTTIREPIPWADKSRAISTFQTLVSGKADGERLQDVVPLVKELIEGLSTEQLGSYFLVSVSIAVQDDPTMDSFNAWAICPSNTTMSDLFVGRESLNGSLVLATAVSPNSAEVKQAQIIAYLNMTHQKDGTYLIKCDEKGVVDIVFRARDNPLFDRSWMMDLMVGMGERPLLGPDIMDEMDDRMFNVKISLTSSNFALAAGSNRVV